MHQGVFQTLELWTLEVNSKQKSDGNLLFPFLAPTDMQVLWKCNYRKKHYERSE